MVNWTGEGGGADEGQGWIRKVVREDSNVAGI